METNNTSSLPTEEPYMIQMGHPWSLKEDIIEYGNMKATNLSVESKQQIDDEEDKEFKHHWIYPQTSSAIQTSQQEDKGKTNTQILSPSSITQLQQFLKTQSKLLPSCTIIQQIDSSQNKTFFESNPIHEFFPHSQ